MKSRPRPRCCRNCSRRRSCSFVEEGESRLAFASTRSITRRSGVVVVVGPEQLNRPRRKFDGGITGELESGRHHGKTAHYAETVLEQPGPLRGARPVHDVRAYHVLGTPSDAAPLVHERGGVTLREAQHRAALRLHLG